METIVFALPGNEQLADTISTGLSAIKGKLVIRKFPDGESYVRVITDVKDKDVILLCTLHDPDEKLLALFFLSKKFERFRSETNKVSCSLSRLHATG